MTLVVQFLLFVEKAKDTGRFISYLEEKETGILTSV